MPSQVEVRLPEIADTMTSATLAAWLKNAGDPVAAGEPIAEVETDKTTVELEAPAGGVLADIRVEAGARDVAVGTVLAVIREDGRAGETGPTADVAPPPAEVRLPELAAGMASATITAWLKKPGDSVVAGEAIAEVETDKTTVELEAPAGGVLADIRVEAGTEAVAVGTLLALVRGRAPGDEGTTEAPPETTALGSGYPEPGSSAPTATGRTPPASTSAPDAAEEAATALVGAVAEPRGSRASANVPATALARRMAVLAGVDIAGVTGSGDGGRVLKVDVERLLRSSRADGAASSSQEAPALVPAVPAPPATPAIPTVAPATNLPHADRPLTAMRRVTAQRMAEAKRSAPHFYLEIECAVDRLPALRGDTAAAGAATGPTGDSGVPTVNDVVVRAAALALREVPLANSTWTGDAVRVYDRVDLAVAVATPAGLVTPVVREADSKPLVEIAADLRRLAADARAGRLQPADYQGGTCTISNLGMYGVSSLYAILNPPQSCILGIGAITERPVVRDGAVAVGSTMKVTLSADHRAIDGATGAELLRALKALIEDPQRVYG